MTSRTPNFDAALDKILDATTPGTRVCPETGESWELTEKDIEMCRLLRVPPPKTVWWADIRKQRAFIAGYDLFLRETIDGPPVISYYDPEAPVQVLGKTKWLDDTYTPEIFFIEFRENQDFFSTWHALSQKVPRPSIMLYQNCESSPYSPYSLDAKDTYASWSGLEMRECVYVDASGWCNHSVEGMLTANGDFCYDFTVCMRSQRLKFCERCEECMDLAFCLGCKNCSDCFGCTNLRGKKFCFLNEQLTEEEYRKRMAEIDLSDATHVATWKEKMVPIWASAFRRAGMITKSENVVGDDIEESRDVWGISIRKSERAYSSYGTITTNDVSRVSWGMELERCYNTTDTYESAETKCSMLIQQCIDVEYSEFLSHCEHCFGCIGLKYKKFCIFNKQYTEQEYWPLVDKIKTVMLQRGEYGDFFPYRVSPFAYNATCSGMMFVYNKEEVEKLGARWYEIPKAQGDALPVSAIPEKMSEVTDDIVTKRFRCPITGRDFSFVPPEIAMHREMNVALPRVHPMVNRLRRTQQALPPRLYDRSCASCKEKVQTRIPPTMTAPILCQLCYEKVIIGEMEAPK